MKKEELYSGKAKTIYKTDNPKQLISEFRDSLTAFDGKKKSEAAKKGYYNAQISKKIFEMLEEEGIKTHYIEMASDTEMLVDAVDIVLIEVVKSSSKYQPKKLASVFEGDSKIISLSLALNSLIFSRLFSPPAK